MRRRSFRPALESLDFRITPSDMAGFAAAASVGASGGATTYRLASPSTVLTPTAIDPADGDSTGDDNSHPDWDDTSGPSGSDDGWLWCPMIGE